MTKISKCVFHLSLPALLSMVAAPYVSANTPPRQTTEAAQDLAKTSEEANNSSRLQKTKPKPVSCFKCKKWFPSQGKLKDHCDKTKHRGFKCEDCPATFPRARALLTHKETKACFNQPGRPSEASSCAKCRLSFESVTELNEHCIQTGHAGWQCPNCGKEFAAKRSLTAHGPNCPQKTNSDIQQLKAQIEKEAELPPNENKATRYAQRVIYAVLSLRGPVPATLAELQKRIVEQESWIRQAREAVEGGAPLDNQQEFTMMLSTVEELRGVDITAEEISEYSKIFHSHNFNT